MSTASSISVTCPSCNAKLRTPAGNTRPTLACPRCGTSIALPTHTGAGDTATRPAGVAGWWRPTDAWTAFDLVIVKTGGTCVAMGVLAHVLPLFGLQFRKLSNLGNSAAAGGTALVVLGAFMVLYVLVLKGRVLRVLLGAAALAVVGLAVILTIAWWSARARQSPPVPNPALQQGFPGPGAPPWGSGGPAAAPGFAGAVPRPPQTPRLDFEALVARYGAHRVVRVRFEGADQLDVAASVREHWRRPGAAAPDSWVVSTRGTEITLSMAPVNSMDAGIAMLALGEVIGTDSSQRLIVLRLDPGKCVPRKP